MASNCTGDCLKCSFQQQTYCAAQLGYGINKNQEAIVGMLNAILERLSSFAAAPTISLLETQSGAGVENRAPETSNPIKNGL